MIRDTDYATLGNDLVIGDAKVAKQYREILKGWSVDISVGKSLISDNESLKFKVPVF